MDHIENKPKCEIELKEDDILIGRVTSKSIRGSYHEDAEYMLHIKNENGGVDIKVNESMFFKSELNDTMEVTTTLKLKKEVTIFEETY